MEITFKTGNRTLTGTALVVPGYEDIDFVAVRSGMMLEVYELCTGAQVADFTAFSEEELLPQVIDILIRAKLTADKLFDKVLSKEQHGDLSDSKAFKVNESPAYDRYKARKQAEHDALPDRYNDQEKAIITEAIVAAEAEGFDATQWKNMRDGKQAMNWKPEPTAAHEWLEAMRKQRRRKELIEQTLPLPGELRDSNDPPVEPELTFERFYRNITFMYKNGDLAQSLWMQVPHDLQARAFEGWKYQQTLFCKMGYWPKHWGDYSVSSTAAMVLASLNARNVKRREGVHEDFATLNRHISGMTALYNLEFYNF